MAKDNEFLNAIKVDQFIKNNNEQIKQNLSGIFSDTTKVFLENNIVQKITNNKLESLVDTNKSSFIDLNKNIDKLNSSLNRVLISQTDTMIKVSNNQIKSNITSIKDMRDEQRGLSKTMNKYVDHQIKLEEPSIWKRTKNDNAENDIMGQMYGNQKKGGMLSQLLGFLSLGSKGLFKSIGQTLWRVGIKPLGHLISTKLIVPLGATLGKVLLSAVSLGMKGLVLGLKILVSKSVLGPIGAFLGGYGIGKLIDKFLIPDNIKNKASDSLAWLMSSDFRENQRREKLKKMETYTPYKQEDMTQSKLNIRGGVDLDDYFGDPEGGGDKVRAITTSGRKAFGLNDIIKSKDIPELKKSKKKKKVKDNVNSEYGFSIPKSKELFKSNVEFSNEHKSLQLYEPWKPDILGLQPDMRNNILRLADEYYHLTGNPLQLNSGKRNGDGHSTHDYGWAVDIQSDQLNFLESRGILKDYGLHRPLLNWDKKKEPWHVEPYPGDNVYGKRNTINNEYRVGTLMNNRVKTPNHGAVATSPERGGDNPNLPQKTIEKRIKSNEKLQVQLSKEDLLFLADEFGKRLKEHKPMKKERVSVLGLESGRNL